MPGDRHVTYTCQVTDPSFFLPQLLVGPCHSRRGQESNSAFTTPPQTHTLAALLWEKGGFYFFPFFFFFVFKHSYSSVPGLSLPQASVVWARSLWPALLHPLPAEGPAIRAGCVALLCVVGKRLASGGPSWPLIILASIKLKHIAHLLHNKPQLFHGSN